MDRRTKVELFEQLRREYEFGVGTVSGVANKFGVHRRQVRQALDNAMPPQRPSSVRACPTLDPVKDFIEVILLADKIAPRKQRHTAHRIWIRLCQEMAEHPVAESTVRAHVRERKWALGLAGKETCIPQGYAWGEEAQVIAALLTGEGVSEVARKFNMPKTTVFRFKLELVPERMEQIGTEKQETTTAGRRSSKDRSRRLGGDERKLVQELVSVT